MTVCPRCGGEAEELVLAGNSIKWSCDNCGQMHVAYAGRAGKLVCPCGNNRKKGGLFTKIGKFDGTVDKAIASQPCKKCEEELDYHAEIVRQGGIYWRCSDCESQGVVAPDSELSKAVREQGEKEPPEPCGVEFNKDWGCPVCIGELDGDQQAEEA
jgi:hypothetical protein